jgi:hypothetical protein
LDLKMPLENGRADERVSRGQASERSVCVCEAVSVEMGARRPQLQTAVVCPPGRRRRRRLAITAARAELPVCLYKCVCLLLQLLKVHETRLKNSPEFLSVVFLILRVAKYCPQTKRMRAKALRAKEAMHFTALSPAGSRDARGPNPTWRRNGGRRRVPARALERCPRGGQHTV